MIPGFNFRPFPMQYEESSEDEDSTSSTDLTSADDLAAPVPSTSSARAVHLRSPRPSTSKLLRIIPLPSTLAMSQMVPGQRTPVDLVPTINPMLSVPSTSRRIQRHSDDFRSEASRRLSFQNWPATFIDAASLAAAGFYYTGSMDNVRCFECQVVVGHWSEYCIPMKIHKECSPKCKFVRNKLCGNIPMRSDPDNDLLSKRRNKNISCPYGLQYTESLASDRLLTRLIRNPTAEKLEYASYVSRLNTFAKWPTYMTQTSEKLADAGFYYSGRNDITICHHCGISIENWSPGEDPWQRHAISSPSCSYLLTIQGREYVNNVTGQKLYETCTETPTQEAVGSDERPNSENEIDEVTLAEKLAALEEENQALRDARSCKVCTEREATITCLPCGHFATCHYCAPAFAQCIICRRDINAVIRTVLA